MILGIDEVGRGPWAGPLVVGAVVLGGQTIEGLTDSKKLTKKRLKELDVVIRAQAQGFGLGWVKASEIDDIGLSRSLELATKRAVQAVHCSYSEIIIDGTINFLKDTSKGGYVTTLPKADLLVPSVSAASIIAKVARDSFMAEQDDIYPGYSFSSHVGYGTAKHREAIDRLGVTPLHRLSFAPLAKYKTNFKDPREAQVAAGPDTSGSPSTVTVGNASEALAAKHLEGLGYEIFERNWKTKYCEIDIVASKDDTIYFVEVKYRGNDSQGGGLAAITPRKLNQMQYAAKFYAHWQHLESANLRLMAIDVVGQPMRVVEVVLI